MTIFPYTISTKRLLLILCLSFNYFIVYSQFTLVKDISVGADTTTGGYPQNFIEWNSQVYFSYWTPESGRELWRTDGTPTGTVLIKDMAPGIQSSFPLGFKAVGPYLYFSANDGVHGNELWRTDGTAQGTMIVSDISPGFFSSNPTGFEMVGENLYFSASTEAFGTELWVTNSSDLKTRLVKDINSRAGSGYPSYLTELNGLLYFSATDTLGNQELWRTDGTEAGTTMVKDIVPGTDGARPWYLTKFNGFIYFRTDGTNGQNEIWKTDGTLAGTTKSWTASGYVANFLTTQNYIYFIDFPQNNSDGNVWKSDGASFFSTIFLSYDDGFYRHGLPTINNVGGKLFMTHLVVEDVTLYATLTSELLDDNGGQILSDNTSYYLMSNYYPNASTALIKTAGGDYYLTKNSFVYSLPPSLLKWNGSSFVEVKTFGANLSMLFQAGNKLIFSTSKSSNQWNAYELFVSDGTTAGTGMLKKVDGQTSSSPIGIIAMDNSIYFSATQNDKSKLFLSDGTSAGTKAVIDTLSVGYYDQRVAVGNELFFSATSNSTGNELWRTDGTAQGTVLVKDIWPGVNGSSNPTNFRILKGNVIFTASDPILGFSLWSTDGTTSGTTMIKDLDPTSTYGVMYEMINAKDSLIYFAARNSQSGWELWRTDGTSNGTFMVKDIVPGSGDAFVRDIISVKGIAYFSAYTSSTGTELWRSDGTEAGTYIVKEIIPGPMDSAPNKLTHFNDGLLFLASGGLWYSDGTDAGTRSIKDFQSGFVNGAFKSDDFSKFVEMGGEVFFFVSGELWKTDGTTSGTTLIIEIHPYNLYDGGVVGDLVASNGILFFSSTEGNMGNPMSSFWKSNGTAAGTSLITDVINPSGFTVAGNSIYFQGTSELGAELWKYTIQNEVTVTVGGNIIANNQLIDLGTHLTTEGITSALLRITNNGPDNVLLTNTPRFTFSANDNRFSTLDTNAYGKILSGNSYELNIVLTTSQAGNLSTSVNFPNSSTSAISSFQLMATIVNPPPVAPVAIDATNVDIVSFTANWNSVEGASSYRLDVSKDNFATKLAGYDDKVVNDLHLSVTSLTSATDYQYRVRAVNSDGVSKNSNIILVTTAPKSDQAIVFDAINAHTLGEDPFLVNAVASSSLPVSFTTSTGDKVLINANQVTLMAAGQATITASQSGNDLFGAAPDVSRTFCINPPKPIVTLSSGNGVSMTLSSSASNGNQWYKNGMLMVGATAATLQVNVTGVYSVESIIESCKSERSDDFSATITGDIAGNNTELMISPNPATDFVNIILPLNDRREITVWSLTGETIGNITSYQSDNTIDVRSYSRGCYVVLVTTAHGCFSGKFIKK